MEEYKDLKGELKKIRRNGESFLGMDGGKIRADVWFCGVEFGGNLDVMSDYFDDDNVFPDGKSDYPFPFRNSCPQDLQNSLYDKFLSAMYIKLFLDKDFTTDEKNTIIEQTLNDKLYNQNSKIFKLNLFPVGKKDISWDESIESKLGVVKDDYYGTIFNNRKAFIKKLVKQYEPKLIICTSTKDYRETFIETFVNTNEKVDFSWFLLKEKFKISVYDNGKTKVIIIPFLGMGDINLNSYKRVIEMAGYIRNMYSDLFNTIKK